MLFEVSRRGRIFSTILVGLMSLPLLMCAGCDALGALTSKIETDVAPAYKGLKGQKVAIMVWADEGLMVDHPSMMADVTRSLKGKLQQGIDAKVDELEDTTLLDAGKILKFQEAHPEYQSDSAEQIALRLPATRLIYVEVQSFSLHPSDSVDLTLGHAVADVRVVEVKDGKAKLAYQNDNVNCTYPEHAPPEGLPNLPEETVYHKTVDALTTELGMLFITHPQDEREKHDEEQPPQ